MNEQECKAIVDQYFRWFQDELSVQLMAEGCELTTPFLDRHRDQLQIYIAKQNGQVIFSDEGYTASELRSSGVEIESGAGREMVERLIKSFGVHLRNRELVAEAQFDAAGERMHSLVQAMLLLNDVARLPSLRDVLPEEDSKALQVISYETPALLSSQTPTVFRAGVENFLEEKHIEYTSYPSLEGRSHLTYWVDLMIPESGQAPLRYIKLVPKPSRRVVKPIVGMVLDTREVRPADSKFYVFFNDIGREVDDDILEPLKIYDVQSVRWTEREEYVRQLAA
jgi:hypothetical protein